ncbi:unnamed protein product [Nyctereutes procyonoides]|uniref:(raccoon dog) hypothetical protein n=1 Tax=Nyctereutes procyonoides TaxID=34880 RepID=A0A811Y1R1_NYCPR|nr:unnamed protein product [Nyctereutes procyonoides]
MYCIYNGRNLYTHLQDNDKKIYDDTWTPLYYQVLNFGMIVFLALMIWKRLMLITGSQSPIVVVLKTGVFKIEEREISIVRGVLKTHAKQNGYIKFLTKGDNTKDVMGRVRGFVPYTGIVMILMNDYPKFKFLVSIIGCYVC